MSPFSGACPPQLSRSDSVAPAAAEAARPRTVGASLGFVDLEGPALEVLAVQGADGLNDANKTAIIKYL